MCSAKSKLLNTESNLEKLPHTMLKGAQNTTNTLTRFSVFPLGSPVGRRMPSTTPVPFDVAFHPKP